MGGWKALLVAAFVALPQAAWADAILFRISTENTADHVQTKAVARFAAELQRRAQGRLTVSHHYDAELFRDRDVVKALRQGQVEMAVPGTWQLDRLEPNVALFLLPTLYGHDAPVLDRLRDGEVGREINRRIADSLDLHVPGRWIDLGFAHLFGVRRDLGDGSDLTGLRVRVAGGEANLRRLAALGAEPRVIPWPDLPRAMADGAVEGILTTHETIASARLWEHGITSVSEDHQYFAQYVPLVSGRVWRRLPGDLQRLIAQVWEDNVATARAEAAEAQRIARDQLAAHGVVIHHPPPEILAQRRRRLLDIQAGLVTALGIDADLAERAMTVMEERRQ